MRYITALVMALVVATPLLADAVEEVRQAEIGFAKAFADRDKDRFFSYVADDAVFISAAATLRGKKEIVERWSKLLEGDAPFSWGPERVEVTSGQNIGFSMGPIYGPDGGHGGYYSSIWQKQEDGTWKIIVDGPGNPTAPLRETALPYEEGFVTTPDGAKLHYEKVGRSPVAIIVPLGFILHDQMKQFADITTVITYDMRGRGRSSKIENLETISLAQDVKDLETVREHFKLEKFTPVGFSYLGKMVMLYAAAHPEHVRSVIQMGPLANTPNLNVKPSTETGAPAEVTARLATLQAEGAEQKSPRDFCLAQAAVMNYYLSGDPKHAPRVKAEKSCELENEWPVNLNRWFGALMSNSRESSVTDDQIGKITARVLTIHGDKDRNAPYSGGREWAAKLPNARLVTVPGAAHAMWVDDPVTTFGAIRHFLRGEWPLGSESVASR